MPPRRARLPRLKLLLRLLLVTAAPLGALTAAAKPNVVLIVADDLGYADVAGYGGKTVPTPQLDRLLLGGVRATAGYVTCPACAPSRFSLLSGAYPQRFGLTWNDDRGAQQLDERQLLLPQLMRRAGYRTGLIGKWNIVRRTEIVFDEVHDFIEWEADYFPQASGRYLGSNATTAPGFASSKTQFWGPKDEGGEYLTERMGRHAAEFISRHAERPFFLLVGFNAVHSPWQGRRQDQDRFRHLPLEVSRLYASMVAALDENVGRILDALREHRLERDTLVVFLSDNGPAKGGPHIAGWPPDWPDGITVVGSAAPFRGAKTDLLEGGIRVPFILRWPARLPAGITYREPVTAMDVLPTVCAAAGIPLPADQVVDGTDLVPHLAGERHEEPHSTLFWKIKSAAALRRGPWKILLPAPDGPAQLYHLEDDPGESRDLAAAQPERANELRALWQTWNATLPPPAKEARRSRK